METVDHPAKKSRLLPLLLLMLVFALPPLAGWVYFMNPQWLPSGRSNHGVLIHPPRPLHGMALREPDGRPFDWRDYRNYWTLAVVSRGACAAKCQEQLVRAGQVLRAIGASRTMVEQLVILLPADVGAGASAESKMASARLVQTTSESTAAAEELFELDRIDPEHTIFVIAPDGALMMRHDLTTTTPDEMLQDLETLLKASQNWVKGG